MGAEQAEAGPNGVLRWAAVSRVCERRAWVKMGCRRARMRAMALERAAERAALPGRVREGIGKEGRVGWAASRLWAEMECR